MANPTPLADQSTYGWRVPSLSDTPDVPRDFQNLADDVARDLARAAPDPTVLGARNGSGGGISFTGNFVTGSMADLLAIPGNITVPTGWSGLVRMEVSCDFLLSPDYGATARFYTRKNGGSWTATAWTGAWGALAFNRFATTTRVQASQWFEYKVCDAGTWEFKVVAGSSNGAACKGYLVKADVSLVTMYPPGVIVDVPAGDEGVQPS